MLLFGVVCVHPISWGRFFWKTQRCHWPLCTVAGLDRIYWFLLVCVCVCVFFFLNKYNVVARVRRAVSPFQNEGDTHNTAQRHYDVYTWKHVIKALCDGRWWALLQPNGFCSILYRELKARSCYLKCTHVPSDGIMIFISVIELLIMTRGRRNIYTS